MTTTIRITKTKSAFKRKIILKIKKNYNIIAPLLYPSSETFIRTSISCQYVAMYVCENV